MSKAKFIFTIVTVFFLGAASACGYIIINYELGPKAHHGGWGNVPDIG